MINPKQDKNNNNKQYEQITARIDTTSGASTNTSKLPDPPQRTPNRKILY